MHSLWSLPQSDHQIPSSHYYINFVLTNSAQAISSLQISLQDKLMDLSEQTCKTCSRFTRFFFFLLFFLLWCSTGCRSCCAKTHRACIFQFLSNVNSIQSRNQSFYL